jgi:hypothetical protein
LGAIAASTIKKSITPFGGDVVALPSDKISTISPFYITHKQEPNLSMKLEEPLAERMRFPLYVALSWTDCRFPLSRT